MARPTGLPTATAPLLPLTARVKAVQPEASRSPATREDWTKRMRGLSGGSGQTTSAFFAWAQAARTRSAPSAVRGVVLTWCALRVEGSWRARGGALEERAIDDGDVGAAPQRRERPLERERGALGREARGDRGAHLLERRGAGRRHGTAAQEVPSLAAADRRPHLPGPRLADGARQLRLAAALDVVELVECDLADAAAR